jgi:hypothetical protein
MMMLSMFFWKGSFEALGILEIVGILPGFLPAFPGWPATVRIHRRR